jgi:3-deoxy-D-manno-octulosonic-acid transferase
MQDKVQADSLRAFVSDESSIIVCGDMKMLRPRPEVSKELNAFVQAWKSRQGCEQILIAGSITSLQEGQDVIASLVPVISSGKALAIIAPRDIEHAGDLIAVASKQGIVASRRSGNNLECELLILDTYGELASAYSVCTGAYIGGAFDDMGHNVLEPIAFGVPVCYGPRRGHFREAQEFTERFGASRRISDAHELRLFWDEVLNDPTLKLNAIRAQDELDSYAETSTQRVAQAIGNMCKKPLNEG